MILSEKIGLNVMQGDAKRDPGAELIRAKIRQSMATSSNGN